VAFRIEDESRIGFWDALIVAAAANSGATRLLSEDLNPGQKIAGLRIENPFAPRPLNNGELPVLSQIPPDFPWFSHF
jgi:hypothetical protein